MGKGKGEKVTITRDDVGELDLSGDTAIIAKKPKGKLVDGKLAIKRRGYNQGTKGTDIVTVDCPHCADEHQHRISSQLTGDLGSKTSHCTPPKQYQMVETEDQSKTTEINIKRISAALPK